MKVWPWVIKTFPLAIYEVVEHTKLAVGTCNKLVHKEYTVREIIVNKVTLKIGNKNIWLYISQLFLIVKK